MIEVIVLIVTGLWLCVSAVLDWKKFRDCPGRLLRLFSLLQLVLLLVEVHFLYGDRAVTFLPDVVCLALMMLLSAPLSCEPDGVGKPRIIAAAVLAPVTLAIPAMPGMEDTLSLLVTLLSVSVFVLAVSVAALMRWLQGRESVRSVAPLQMAGLWVRGADILLLLLLAGVTALVRGAYAQLLWMPLGLLTVFFGVLYYRAGTPAGLSSPLWVRHLAVSRPDTPVSQPPDPLDEEFYNSVYRKCCHYMESKKPFLVESFSLNDLAAGVFTNKSYVSKAINHSSSLNFRRFVNRYRVAYAQEIFRKNMSLRVQDLTSLSGCHSIQTFCAIFKLFTGETPRDWCARMRKDLQ